MRARATASRQLGPGARREECPSCGDPVIRVLYVPDEQHLRPARHGGPRTRMVLDAAPRPDDEEYANYAVSGSSQSTCRLITDLDPLAPPLERRHTHHYATHPECRPNP